MEKKASSLDEIFSPRSVAVVGASPAEDSFATRVVIGLKEAGHPAIYPVNPRYSEVAGLPCYPNIRAIQGNVDHVVVCIPAEAAPALLDDCAAKGIRSVHFFTAGFSESGYAERAELERSLLRQAKAGGFRIIGPNCVGLYVPRSRVLNATGLPLEPGPVAFISQSGGNAIDMPYLGAPRGIRFSKVVSYGNALDVNESELLEYLAVDAETRIIAAYIEGVKDGRHFLASLRKATAQKPVVIYKGGQTQAGGQAAHSHTASMTSSADVFCAACRQAGAIVVDNLDEMVDMLVALCFATPYPRHRGVVVFGAGGGPSVLASDELEKAGLSLPPLSPEVQEKLLKSLPLAGSILCNPVDAGNLATPDAVSATARILGGIPEADMLVFHLGFHPIGRWRDGRFATEGFLQPVISAFTDVRERCGKPVLVALRPAPDLNGAGEFLAVQAAFARAGFAVFHSFRELAGAADRMVTYTQSR